MDKKTLKALQGSIKKWEKIVEGKGSDKGYENCPLCKLFGDNRCVECPVAIKMGIENCFDTPYDSWTNHQDEKHDIWNSPYKIECSKCKKIAEKELKFLKSLLPKEAK
jgi:hypothetical protein